MDKQFEIVVGPPDPNILVKNSWKTIRSQSLGWMKTFNSWIHFLLSKRGYKHLIHLLCDSCRNLIYNLTHISRIRMIWSKNVCEIIHKILLNFILLWSPYTINILNSSNPILLTSDWSFLVKPFCITIPHLSQLSLDRCFQYILFHKQWVQLALQMIFIEIDRRGTLIGLFNFVSHHFYLDLQSLVLASSPSSKVCCTLL